MEEQLKAILERLDKLDMKIDIVSNSLEAVMERQQQEKRQGIAGVNKAIDMLNKRLEGEEEISCCEVVYVIKNKINGREYYGATGNIKQRFYSHFKKLNRGIHENDALQKDFNKYGAESFISDVLEIDYDREYILFREKQLIQENPNCYNVLNNSEGAKKDGVYLGRPKTNVINDEFVKAYDRWKAGEIKAVEAMKEANLSKTAFYRLVKMYEVKERATNEN